VNVLALGLMSDSIRSLLLDFNRDPFTVSRMLRERRDQDPASFQSAAMESLIQSEDSPATRQLVTILHENSDLLPRIVDPNLLELEPAVRLILALRRTDPQTDIRLIRLIMPGAKPVTHAVTDRILDLIDAVCDGPKLIPLLMQLYRSAPNHVRVRLAIAIGRHHRNRDWIYERLRDPDPRVRANTVEVFSGERSPEALEVFRLGLSDNDPNVIANAAIALHRAGSVEALAPIGLRLASHEAPDFRVAAARAMGFTRDARFQHILARFVKDGDPQVRRSAFQALNEIKRKSVSVANHPRCSLRFLKIQRSGDGQLHIQIEVKSLGDHPQPVKGILPLEISAYANGEPVWDYMLSERTKHHAGVYDLQFASEHARSKTLRGGTSSVEPMSMLKIEVTVITSHYVGTHASYWFGEQTVASA
jgi:hypothetical protein